MWFIAIGWDHDSRLHEHGFGSNVESNGAERPRGPLGGGGGGVAREQTPVFVSRGLSSTLSER